MKEERDKMALEMYENWLVSGTTSVATEKWHHRSCLFISETNGLTLELPPACSVNSWSWSLF